MHHRYRRDKAGGKAEVLETRDIVTVVSLSHCLVQFGCCVLQRNQEETGPSSRIMWFSMYILQIPEKNGSES